MSDDLGTVKSLSRRRRCMPYAGLYVLIAMGLVGCLTLALHLPSMRQHHAALSTSSKWTREPAAVYEQVALRSPSTRNVESTPATVPSLALSTTLPAPRASTSNDTSASQSVIPRLLHQSWKSADDIPEVFVPWMRSWVQHHPTWRYVFWDDDANLALFARHYPQYYAAASSVGKIHLADMARYALLHRFGGVYVDCDFESTLPLDDLINEDLFLSTEPFVHAVLLERADDAILCNAVLASRRGHPFWLEVLDAILVKFQAGGAKQDPVSLTGPRLVEAVYHNFDAHRAGARVTVFPEEYFYPEIAYWNLGQLLQLCRDRLDPLGRKACNWLRDHPKGLHTTKTHAVHHWQCTWCRGDVGQAVMSLRAIFPDVTIHRPLRGDDDDAVLL